MVDALDRAASRVMTRLHATNGMTRLRLAELSGISEGQVSALLNAVRPWYLSDIEAMCAALDVPFGETLDAIVAEASAPAPVSLDVERAKRGRRPGSAQRAAAAKVERDLTADDD